MLKRNNWTNEEILEILRSRLIGDKNGPESADYVCGHDNVLESLIDEFASCKLDSQTFGAYAYDTEQKEFVHIGEIPDDVVLKIDP